jgi:tRNA threonylcarbamoyl adenosine modification protein YeaZ
MRVLAIDCATEACSVALFEGGALIDGAHRLLGRGHAEHLVPMIAALPDRGRAERIAVSRGPGSFTGVRIGLAAARALALAWGAELVGYPTLALIAAIAREQDGSQAVTVAMSGGHGEWFVQEFGTDGLPAAALASLTAEAAAKAASAALVAGSQAEALIGLRGHGTALPLLPDARQFPLLPEALVTPDLTALYGRPPDARLPEPRA